jgi:hypothetical protein
MENYMVQGILEKLTVAQIVRKAEDLLPFSQKTISQANLIHSLSTLAPHVTF